MKTWKSVRKKRIEFSKGFKLFIYVYHIYTPFKFYKREKNFLFLLLWKSFLGIINSLKFHKNVNLNLKRFCVVFFFGKVFFSFLSFSLVKRREILQVFFRGISKNIPCRICIVNEKNMIWIWMENYFFYCKSCGAVEFRALVFQLDIEVLNLRI